MTVQVYRVTHIPGSVTVRLEYPDDSVTSVNEIDQLLNQILITASFIVMSVTSVLII